MLPTPRPYVRADGAVAPDHWLDPTTVWEVKCADLSLSPIYPAARGLVSAGAWARVDLGPHLLSHVMVKKALEYWGVQ